MAHVVETSSLSTLLIPQRLSAEGIRVFVPTYTRKTHHTRRGEVKTYSLYGRYVFAWFDASQLRTVLKCKGVVGVLRKAGSIQPSVVDDALVEGIAAVVDPGFLPGEPVRVTCGRLEGLDGLFSRCEDDRVMVMLSMLGRKVEMPFHSSELRRNPNKDMDNRSLKSH